MLTNTTANVFITNWVIPGITEQNGEEIEVFIRNAGTYDVSMTTFGSGGSASIIQQIVVEQTVTGGCFGNMELLTDCGEKTWRLANESSAMHIGPNLEETWWGNSESDITDRFCHWDDEYIFRVNGEFEYRNNGDLWVDADENGNVWPSDMGLPVGCNNSEDLPEKFQSWGSGIHTFEIDENNFSVIGEGAWVGLYKIGTNDEVTSPQSSVTFSIASLSADRMVIFADYGLSLIHISEPTRPY